METARICRCLEGPRVFAPGPECDRCGHPVDAVDVAGDLAARDAVGFRALALALDKLGAEDDRTSGAVPPAAPDVPASDGPTIVSDFARHDAKLAAACA